MGGEYSITNFLDIWGIVWMVEFILILTLCILLKNYKCPTKWSYLDYWTTVYFRYQKVLELRLIL